MWPVCSQYIHCVNTDVGNTRYLLPCLDPEKNIFCNSVCKPYFLPFKMYMLGHYNVNHNGIFHVDSILLQLEGMIK